MIAQFIDRRNQCDVIRVALIFDQKNEYDEVVPTTPTLTNW